MTIKHYVIVLILLFLLHYIVTAVAGDVVPVQESHSSDVALSCPEPLPETSRSSVEGLGTLARVSQYFFDLDSFTNGRPHGLSELGLSLKLKRAPDSLVVLVGYTDQTGGERHNYHLSVDRVQWLKGKLIERGVASDRIVTFALGESEPRFFAGQEDLNRRVDVYIGANTR